MKRSRQRSKKQARLACPDQGQLFNSTPRDTTTSQEKYASRYHKCLGPLNIINWSADHPVLWANAVLVVILISGAILFWRRIALLQTTGAIVPLLWSTIEISGTSRPFPLYNSRVNSINQMVAAQASAQEWPYHIVICGLCSGFDQDGRASQYFQYIHHQYGKSTAIYGYIPQASWASKT